MKVHRTSASSSLASGCINTSLKALYLLVYFVREVLRYHTRPKGGFMITCGNGLIEDTPLESLEVLLDERFRYGAEIDSKNY